MQGAGACQWCNGNDCRSKSSGVCTGAINDEAGCYATNPTPTPPSTNCYVFDSCGTCIFNGCNYCYSSSGGSYCTSATLLCTFPTFLVSSTAGCNSITVPTMTPPTGVNCNNYYGQCQACVQNGCSFCYSGTAYCTPNPNNCGTAVLPGNVAGCSGVYSCMTSSTGSYSYSTSRPPTAATTTYSITPSPRPPTGPTAPTPYSLTPSSPRPPTGQTTLSYCSMLTTAGCTMCIFNSGCHWCGSTSSCISATDMTVCSIGRISLVASCSLSPSPTSKSTTKSTATTRQTTTQPTITPLGPGVTYTTGNTIGVIV